VRPPAVYSHLQHGRPKTAGTRRHVVNAVKTHYRTVSVYQALRRQVDLSLGRFPEISWKCRPGRPPERWLDQIRDDSQRSLSAVDVWRDALIEERRTGP